MIAYLIISSLCLFKFPHEEKSFLNWMRETNNLFTCEEYHSRLAIWLTNKRLVQEHNIGENGFKIEMNHLSHLSPSEYSSLLGFKMDFKKRIQINNLNFNNNNNIPDHIDYREKGFINEIKDQGECGSCWAFAAIQAQESQWAKISGTLYSLSESNLLDCVTPSHGCQGGSMIYAYDYIIYHQNGLFMKEEDYPYVARKENCKFDKNKGITKIIKYIEIIEGSEQDLANKVANIGVCGIAIDASHYSFQLYSNGIYNEKYCSSTSLDHGVGCIGYGSENSINFWIIRNSWGNGWGEKGYMRMIKDKNNQCGVATAAVVPIDN